MTLHTISRTLRGSLCLVALLAFSFTQSTTSAGTFHWGDFAGTDVQFLNVTENNAEPVSLFAPMPGVGGPFAIGNSLHLDPQNFSSLSSNNSANLLDSTLSTIIMSGPGSWLNSIHINELGDYSLGGLIGGQANAGVGAAFFWKILEIDNAPVNLPTQATNMIFSTGAGANGGQYSRPADDGITVIWNGVSNIDLGGYLNSLNLAGNVTKVSLRFENTLQTSADDVSDAFIKKKSIDIHVDTMVPEPTTALLLGLGIALVPCYRRRS